MAAMDVRSGVADANGMQIAYEDIGDVDAPPVLLIMGFSAQLTLWPVAFCELLATHGYRVIRFDNRDIGLSTKLTDLRVVGPLWSRMARYQLGQPSPVPYTLVDMAADAVGLLDHLAIESAHVVGASMGGMIAQIFAAEYRERVRSLGIVFSTTNQPFLPPSRPAALLALIKGPPDLRRESVIANSVKARQIIGSPKYPETREAVEAAATLDYERDYTPAGIVRQFAAAIGTGSLLPYAKRIVASTVVIHGSADPLIRPACGKAVARAIPGARLHLIDGMGHNLPTELHTEITDVLVDNFRRAS